MSRVNTADERVTDHEKGGLRESASALNVALAGSGFFAIQTEDNGVVYTRDGSFNLDDERYLVLQGVGRVLGVGGQPIQLPTDRIGIDQQGNITSEDGFQRYGALQIVDFADYAQLTKITGDVFRTQAAPQVATDPQVRQRMVESSNVSMAEEMTQMISGQRSLQSAAQILKIYDQLEGKMVLLGSVT